MSGGQRLFGRWRGRFAQVATAATEPSTSVSGVGLQVWIDDQAIVQRLAGPLRSALALPTHSSTRLQDCVQPYSLLVLEGEPTDWQAQSLDLDFKTASGGTLHTRGWLQAQPDGWLLQLFDIGDLLQHRQQSVRAERQRHLTSHLAAALRDCSIECLGRVAQEQLQWLVHHWRASGGRILLQGEAGWQTYATSSDPLPWPSDEVLGPLLGRLAPGQMISSADDAALRELLPQAGAYLLPYAQGHCVQAWLICVGAHEAMVAADALNACAAYAEPLVSRLAAFDLQQQSERMDSLQLQLGAGWWQWRLSETSLQLDPGLAATLGVPARLTVGQCLSRVHPADREAAQLALAELQRDGCALHLNVRLLDNNVQANPRWYRLCGQVRGSGQQRRLQGFMLDISDIKFQQVQASAAQARLENLIASSPAVIYIQRYAEGALQAEFFSASLHPMLGWAQVGDEVLQPAQWVHPEDQSIWLARTRTLLREGQVRSRYRLRDHLGGYHWVLDEARLLRDDLGLPVEVVGIWLDVTEATEAAERTRVSEERYRVLVEDSPAMICRYTPELNLVFGNQPLADYLECSTAQLPGINLGQWMSAAQRDAFVERLAGLTVEQPVSTAEICLTLPGREHAWWVWADRGLFDAQGRLLEIQAVGRDNTQVRRTQQQLLQSAKMATLGEMATGLAHEINQPLNVMRMAVVNALKRLENGDVQADYLQDKLKRIDAQVQRASRVVDHMRVFGRRSEVEQQLFAPWQAVEGALSLLAEGLRGKGVELRVETPAQALMVSGHQDQLEQVLINLMVNARDALLARREQQRELNPWIAVRMQAGERQVQLLVEDNGGGIEPRLLERIFEPFFTTKPVGVGTGLGLSVSYGIIDAMGGCLSAENAAEGACFRIELPVHSTS
ncbi:PAS domain-containing sensor histidine kinase [Pseudomonas alkylphenolica]|uniref:PAS domain-containing sensor histidine kinase n=1 Tax=Pseudomonas alkylphenolica TaxID=237609 RepID=UPI0018D5F011|nr:PAS domain-containing sensor histidine kinase [Pseudomonas alkylphenolica]MBH3427514.1 PAS domain-containing protein [Pseudomonas alkylphenolica]